MNDEIQEIRYLVGEAWKGTYSPTTPYGNANVVQDPTGLSVYRSLKPGNVGHPLTDTAWWFCIIDLSSIKAESDRIAALNTAIAQDEQLRVAAEQSRVQAEQARVDAEAGRVTAEQGRVTAEQQRVLAEQQRASQEQTRISQEQSRVTAEQGRVAAEAQRVQKEQLREDNEAQRVINETNRVAAEAERVEQYAADHQQAVADHDQYVDSLGAFDISAYHATGGLLAKYSDLTEALGTNGANIPEALRKGGMSVKYVYSSDNKYVQARLMANSFTTNTTQWQCSTSEIKAGSKDLAESGGVFDSVRDDIIGADVINKTVNVSGTSTTTTGITLKKDIKYVIYVQCLTAVDNSATGIYVYVNSNYTKIKALTAAEFAAGSEFEYTPSANCTLYVRPYATGTVAVKVWDMTNYLTLKQLEASVDNVEKKAELGSNIHIATYVPAFEEEDFVVTSTSADVKSTGVIPNQRIKVYIKSSELQRFAVYDVKNTSAGPIIEIPNGTDFSDGYTFEFTCPETMVADQYGHYQIAFRTWLATTLDNFNCYRLEPNPSTEDTVIKNKVRGLENFKTNISTADVIAAIAGENLKFSNIQYDSDGKILSSGLNWPDGGGGTMTIHYDGDVIDYIDYTKVEGTLGNTGTYRQSLIYYSNGNVQGNQITKIA